MIPQISRGGANQRGGGRGVYQANRGQSAIGRGRGGGPQQQRGGMNPSAQQFSPQGGQKRTRDEGSMGGPGNGPKRARGGGQ